VLRRIAYELDDFLQNRGRGLECSLESSGSEELILGVVSLRDSVGVEKERIAGFQERCAGFDWAKWRDAKRGVFGLERSDFVFRFEEGGWMAKACESEMASVVESDPKGCKKAALFDVEKKELVRFAA